MDKEIAVALATVIFTLAWGCIAGFVILHFVVKYW